ncbi:MAG: TIGR03790 family protein [Myxococcales bacterium]|nr:TIGR03790 family protein [Myxococcales bacterium]
MRRSPRTAALLASPLRWLLAAWLLAASGCSDSSAPAADLADAVADAAIDAPAGDVATPDSAPSAPTVTLPRTSITAAELALVVNEQDPQSVAVASYYQAKRAIPAANVVRLSFAPATTITPTELAALKTQLDAALGPDIEGLAITWTQPHRVGCMSITSALTFGYADKWCNDKSKSGQSCGQTAPSPYFASDTTRPFTDHGIRPAMMLAGLSTTDVEALVDRGLAAEATFPSGLGYLVRTTDTARSVRHTYFQQTVDLFDPLESGLDLRIVDNSAGAAADNHISGAKDVLFYFTGLAQLDKLDTNTYLPGAVADHLTSFGGQIKDANAGGQTSCLRWLEAGVTGSYGTVVEPCNFVQKFPFTVELLSRYFGGATLLEAYWKSVRWPGEGIFIGDPLARPWGSTSSYDAGSRTLTIKTSVMRPGKTYELRARVAGGAWQVVASESPLSRKVRTFVVSPVAHDEFELREKP